jgi:hypothetical protein
MQAQLPRCSAMAWNCLYPRLTVRGFSTRLPKFSISSTKIDAFHLYSGDDPLSTTKHMIRSIDSYGDQYELQLIQIHRSLRKDQINCASRSQKVGISAVTKTSEQAPIAVLLHGAVSNGKIFYSAKSAGLGPFLARGGVDVFVADLRGRGGSVPSIADEVRTKGSVRHGQTESITQDIPLIAHAVAKLTSTEMIQSSPPENTQPSPLPSSSSSSSSSPQAAVWMAHSWGGVVLTSALARDTSLRPLIQVSCSKPNISRNLSFSLFSLFSLPANVLCTMYHAQSP